MLLAATLFAATLAAYFPAHGGGLLLDDDLHITRPDLQGLGGLWRIWTRLGATQQYYPVLHSAFWVEHRLWGDAVAGYHLVNVLLHASGALLIVPLMRRLRLPGGWLAAFLFALHPVCVESVAWIAEQKNTLSAVFALGAAIAYLDFDADRRGSRYWAATALFALALLSKTVVFTLPAVLLVVAWWRHPRLDFRRDVRPLLPWFTLGAAVCAITLFQERALLAGIGATLSLTATERLLLAGRVFWFYVGKLLWPAGLTFFYPKWELGTDFGPSLIYPLGACALAAGLWVFARRRRGPFAAFLCFAGTLVPVLGFFDLEWHVFSYVADHLQYLSIPCFIVPVAAALAFGACRIPDGPRRLVLPAAGVLVAVLAALTWRQCVRYGDPEGFYRSAAALNPASAAAHNHLGTVLAAKGRAPEAIAEFETALRISPNAPDGEENLGTVLLADPARRAEAASHLETAIRLRPGKKATHDKLAYLLSGIPGREADALAHYQASLRIDPTDADSRNSMGSVLLRLPGRLDEAKAAFESAIHIRPDFAEAHSNLGNVLKRVPGRLDDAMGEYNEALRLKPDFAEAHNGLGLALAQTPGRIGDAIAQFQEALRLKPDFAEAHSNLGLAWTFVPGRINDAISELQEALRLRPEFAPGWHVLGMVWNQLGNAKEAAAAFRQELRISPGNPAALEALAAVNAQAEGP